MVIFVDFFTLLPLAWRHSARGINDTGCCLFDCVVH